MLSRGWFRAQALRRDRAHRTVGEGRMADHETQEWQRRANSSLNELMSVV
jgi:hypothetical protein